MSRKSSIKETFTARGDLRFEIEIWHDELNKYKVIRGKEEHIVMNKAKVKMAQWDEKWEKETKLNSAKKQTENAQNKLVQVENLLSNSLASNFKVTWDDAYDNSDFSVIRPEKPVYPDEPILPKIPPRPIRDNQKYKPDLTLLDYIMPKRKRQKEEEKRRLFHDDLKKWEANKKELEDAYQKEMEEYNFAKEALDEKYKKQLEEWDAKFNEFYEDQTKYNEKVTTFKDKFDSGSKESVQFFFKVVLLQSEYPFEFERVIECVYQPESKMLVVNYHLPKLEDIPSLKEVKYIKSRDEFREKYFSKRDQEQLYEDIIYQITLRSIHEIIEMDSYNHISAVAFNGYIRSVDSGTGKEILPCILSVSTTVEEFNDINLERVTPKSCFQKLKGISGTKLVSVTPIAPLVELHQEDSRFIESREVVESLEEGENLAAMDWEDFEHLIRELFEKEFEKEGGNIKITRASRDHGVDAIAFDPDPLRGGKIVIQAKRYTNTVGVSAVRDLYGTVLNEGATKGILVTTSNYGPDAFEFARDKPISLLNGNNLLHLLENHNYNFSINLSEAKKLLEEK